MEENRQRRFTDTAYIQKQITADKDGKTLRGDLFLPLPAEGKYPLVICSHVLGAKRHTMHKYCRIFASHGAAAVCFDFGGCGESDGDPLQMSLLTEAEDLKTIISSACEWDFVKRDMIILLGESQGGAASAIAAAEMKEYVKGMILCFPALNIPDVFEELYPDPSSVPDSFYFRWLTLGKKYAEDVRNYDIYSVIPEYEGPVLLMHGDNDDLVDISYSEKAAEVYRDVSYHVIEGAGHRFRDDLFEQAEEYIFSWMKENRMLLPERSDRR